MKWIVAAKVKINNVIHPLLVFLLLNNNKYISIILRCIGVEQFLKCIVILVYNKKSIRGGRVFIAKWYRNRYQDVCPLIPSIVFHVLFGENEDRDPSPYFSTIYYRRQNHGKFNSNISPLIHFIVTGRHLYYPHHPLFEGNSTTRVGSYNDSHKYKLFTVVSHKCGTSTPQWMFSLEFIKTDNPWICINKYRGVELKITPVRVDTWCIQHGISVDYFEQNDPVRIANIEKIFNGNGIVPYRQCKVGLRYYVAKVGDVLAAGGLALFYSCDGTLCCDYLYETTCRNDTSLLFSLGSWKDNVICLAVRKKVIERGILMTHFLDTNYYHWIVEGLPRLLPILDDAKYDSYPIILTRGLHENIVRSVKLLAPDRDLIFIDKLCLTRVKDAVYPSEPNRSYEPKHGFARNGHFRQDLSLLSKLASKLKTSIKIQPAFKFDKVYLTRRGYSRDLQNSHEVETFLAQRGFEILDPAKLTFDEQISLFAQAKVIISPSSSALTGIIFCHSSTIVCSLHPANVYKSLFTWQALARVSGVILYSIFERRSKDRDIQDRIDYFHSQYEIDINSLSEFLNQI